MSSSQSSSSNKFIFTAAAIAAATTACYFIYSKYSTMKKQKQNPKIAELWIFPIAGSRGFCIDKPGESWNLVAGGLEFDREFAFAVPVKDSDGKIISMKKVNTLPIQNEIFTKIENAGETSATLVVSYKNAKTDLRVPLHYSDEEKKKQVIYPMDRYGTPGKAIDLGDDVAKWFQEQVFADLLDEKRGIPETDKNSYENNKLNEVRLVRAAIKRIPLDKPSHLGSGATESDCVNFQAFSALHLMSKESIAWLQTKLPRGTTESSEVACSDDAARSSSSRSAEPMKINAERFRANIVLENVPNFEDDKWQRCEIVNSVTKICIPLHFGKYTDRCEVPTMNPATGRRHPNYEPTATIKKVRGAKQPYIVKRWEEFQKELEERRQQGGVEVNEEEEMTKRGIKKPVAKAMFGIEMFHEKRDVVVNIGDEIVVKEVAKEGLKFE